MNIDEDGYRLRLLKHISASSSHLNQRDLTGYPGISPGKTHYCLTGLIKSGYVKDGEHFLLPWEDDDTAEFGLSEDEENYQHTPGLQHGLSESNPRSC
jgi:hypothetical protein